MSWKLHFADRTLSRLPISYMEVVAGRPLGMAAAHAFRLYLRIFGYPLLMPYIFLHPALTMLNLKPGMSVLDAGCGKGFITYTLIREWGCRYVGVDLAQPRLMVAAHIGQGLGLEAEFARMDLAALGFRQASFDRILCLEVIEHIPDDLGALRELARVLKPGGRLVLSTPAVWDYDIQPYRPNYAAISPAKPLGHVRSGYTREQLRQLFEECGLSIKVSRPIMGWRTRSVYFRVNEFKKSGNWIKFLLLFPLVKLMAVFERPCDRVRGYDRHLICAVKP